MKKTSLCALFAMTVMMIGCAPFGPRLPDSLEERSQLRWDSILAGEHEAAYALFSPGYRSAVSLDQFRAKLRARTVAWTSAEFVGTKDCAETVCTVKMKIGYRVSAALPGVSTYESSRVLEERWINDQQGWFMVPDKLD